MNVPDRVDGVRLPDDPSGNPLPKMTCEIDEKIANTATFHILREDHTVGNILRMELLRDPNVKFAGYRHAHPLDRDITVKVQASKRTDPWQATVQAASRLDGELRAIESKFKATLRAQEHAEEAQYD